MGSLSTDNSESSFQLKMKAFTLILLLVIAYAVASPAAVNKNAKKKLYESLKDESTDEVPCEEDTLEEVKPIKEKDIIIKDKAIADSRDKEDEIPSVSAGGKCGPEHGRCSNIECCSLAKECGRTTAH